VAGKGEVDLNDERGKTNGYLSRGMNAQKKNVDKFTGGVRVGPLSAIRGEKKDQHRILCGKKKERRFVSLFWSEECRFSEREKRLRRGCVERRGKKKGKVAATK